MRRISVVVVGSVTVITSLMACKKDPPPPATPTTSSAQPPYTQPAPSGSWAPQPGQPGQPGQPVPGQMAVPGPAALACQNDSQCMTHRCNTQYQKCAFPCQSDADCIQGSTCFVGGGALAACLPKPPGQ
jgi:hypothetical protein